VAAGAAPQRIRCGRASLCRLGAFPTLGFLPDPDCRATLVLPVRGPFTATALVSFSPEDALAWVRWQARGEPPRGADVLEAYRRAAAALAGAVLQSLFGAAVVLEAGRLDEDALLATLLRTHAPRETLLLSAELALECGAERLAAAFYLLLDGKAAEAAHLGLG
jgi:hypothetical protein